MGVNTYEKRDIDVKAVALFAAGLTTALVIAHFVVVGLFRHFRSTSPPAAIRAQPPPTGLRLSVDLPKDLEALRAREDALLHSYDWVDREHGVARIPIEQAMELMEEK